MVSMATMIKALYQGKEWKNGEKRVVAHRGHRVHVDRKKRTRLGAPKFKFHELRGNKRSQHWRRRRNEEIQHYKYIKWQRDHPNKPKKENPFRVKAEPFVNREMREALIEAGVIKA